MSGSKKVFIAGISLVLVLIVLLGCVPNKKGGFSCVAAPLLSKLQSMLPAPQKAGQPPTTVAGSQTQASAGPTRPHPPVRTGDITIGPKVDLASQSVDPSGGTIAVSRPGDPLDGFVINVPPQSYADSRTFKVSSAPITNQTFGSDINPVSPMISVDNGGGYADELMYIRVPVKVPEDSFAMGFLYDEKSKQLEGMPLVGMDAESVTLATRHFSSFFISMIKKALLKKDIDSGFRPGIDDWQFPNAGSFIATSGHCEGQSVTAMWYYYTQPDGKDLCLYGRYDNNGNQPATPRLWQDDSLGYRLCSVIQAEPDFKIGRDFWGNLSGRALKLVNNKWLKVDVPGIGDELTFNLFVYSILVSGEPQEVSIYSNAGGAHAMIVYMVVGNALYIADPNYPGNTERKIIYYSGEGKFKPYSSGANRKAIDAGNGKTYEKIMYISKGTMYSWAQLAQRWAEFKNKTIGNDKFPAYMLQYKDDKGQWQELKDGYESPVKLINIAPSFGNSQVFRDGAALPKGEKELKPGNNLLGIYVVGQVGTDFEYVDFKYINVIYEGGECRINPAQVQGDVNDKYTFTAIMDNRPAKPTYEWYFNDELAYTGESKDYSVTFTSAGSHTVSVKVLDEKGNEVGEANAAIEIKAPVAAPQGGCKFAYICKPVTPQIVIYGSRMDANKVSYNPPGVPIQLSTSIPKEQFYGIIYKWTIDNAGTIEKKEYKGSTGAVSFTPKAVGTYKVKVECYCSSCPDIKVGEAESSYHCEYKP